jgi:flagellar protein FlaG
MKIQDTSNVSYAPPSTEKNVGSTTAATTQPTPPPAAATSAAEVKDVNPPSPAEVKASIDKINQELKQNSVNLDFSIDKNTNESVVKVIDSSTGDIITQFPSKEALAISESIANKQKGALVSSTA